MRALIGLLLCVAACAALPASARAQEPMCRLDHTDMAAAIAFQGQFGTYLSKITLIASGQTTGGEATDAVRTVLGPQLALSWLDFARQGWSVAYSPGPHDAASARAAVREYLAARLDPAAVDFLDRTLNLLPTPYSAAELEATRVALAPLTGPGTPFSGYSIGCTQSDAVRVEVGVAEAETPELRAHVESVLAPFGDKVVVRYGTGWASPIGAIPHPETAPAPQPRQRPTLKVRDYVTLPRTSRCARTVGARPRVDGVRRVRLQIGRRVSAGTAPRIKLKSRRSRVTVTVTLADGSVAIERLTYRRCA